MIWLKIHRPEIEKNCRWQSSELKEWTGHEMARVAGRPGK
jgi:hypothetical protein